MRQPPRQGRPATDAGPAAGRRQRLLGRRSDRGTLLLEAVRRRGGNARRSAIYAVRLAGKGRFLMIQIVWQYEVKEDSRSKFELAYGPGGAWSELFAKCTGFRGTVLLRDTKDPRRYLTIDSWETEAQRAAMLAEHADEYSALDSAFREWTIDEAEVGIYRILAEAMVRPSISKQKGKLGSGRRRSRGSR